MFTEYQARGIRLLGFKETATIAKRHTANELASERRSLGMRRGEVVTALRDDGLDPQAVAALRVELAQIDQQMSIIGRLQSDAALRDEERSSAVEDIFKGLGCLLIAALVTGGTYASAGPGGGYVVTWGAFAVGALIVIGGIIRYFSRR